MTRCARARPKVSNLRVTGFEVSPSIKLYDLTGSLVDRVFREVAKENRISRPLFGIWQVNIHRVLSPWFLFFILRFSLLRCLLCVSGVNEDMWVKNVQACVDLCTAVLRTLNFRFWEFSFWIFECVEGTWAEKKTDFASLIWERCNEL